MCIDFINKLENKQNTMIGENGVKLSGGESQRLSIARAFLKNSRIILLDEATSSLDTETEKKIQTALDVLTYNKTTIVIWILSNFPIISVGFVNILDKFFASVSMLSFPCLPVKVFAFLVLTKRPLIVFLCELLFFQKYQFLCSLIAYIPLAS